MIEQFMLENADNPNLCKMLLCHDDFNYKQVNPTALLIPKQDYIAKELSPIPKRRDTTNSVAVGSEIEESDYDGASSRSEEGEGSVGKAVNSLSEGSEDEGFFLSTKQ